MEIKFLDSWYFHIFAKEKRNAMNSLMSFIQLHILKSQDIQGPPIAGIAIVYMSKHGTTNKVAQFIKELMVGEEVTLINLNEQKAPDLSYCSHVVVGGSIHMGRIQKEVHVFCQKNVEVLKSRPLGLFLCCMYDGEKANEQFNNAFPEQLRAAAKTKALMGYELYFDRMNPIERSITKNITGYNEFKSQIDHLQITRFVKELNK